jgi:hypothetical protein
MNSALPLVAYGAQDVYITASPQDTVRRLIGLRLARAQLNMTRRQWYEDYLCSGDLSGPMAAMTSGLFTQYFAARQFQDHLSGLARLEVQLTRRPNALTRSLPIELVEVIWSHMRWRLPPRYIRRKMVRTIMVCLQAALRRARQRIDSRRRRRWNPITLLRSLL